jgi:hypothetical protein
LIFWKPSWKRLKLFRELLEFGKLRVGDEKLTSIFSQESMLHNNVVGRADDHFSTLFGADIQWLSL